jgi:hypothetical protein
VKSFKGGLSSALLAISLLAIAGCGPDNETDADKLAKSTASPGGDFTKVDTAKEQPPPSSPEDYAKRASEGQRKIFKQGTYPGAKK